MTILKKAAVYLLVGLSGLSLVAYYLLKNAGDTYRLVLVGRTSSIAQKAYDLDFEGTSNGQYKLGIRFFKNDAESFRALAEGRLDYGFVLWLQDDSGSLNQSKEITKNSPVEQGWTADYGEILPLTFTAKRGAHYHLKFELQGGALLDRMQREIFVMRDMDYAAIPYLGLMRSIALAVLFVALALLAVLSARWHAGKKRVRYCKPTNTG